MRDERPERRRRSVLDWIVMLCVGGGVAGHALAGTAWWATLVWVVVFVVPGLAVLERMLVMQWRGGQLLGPVVFGVILISWAMLRAA